MLQKRFVTSFRTFLKHGISFKSLEQLTKLAFNKRRKSIKNSLKNINNISHFLKELNIEDQLRPEQLSVDQFCRLANLIYNFKK